MYVGPLVNEEFGDSTLSRAWRSGRFGLVSLFVLTVLSAAYTFHHGNTARLLAEDGVVVEAVVTKSIVVPRTRGNKKRYEHQFEVTFQTEEGQEIRQTRRSRTRNHKVKTKDLAWQVGDQLTVRYWRADPSVYEIYQEGAEGKSDRGILVTLLFGFIGLLYAGYCLFQARRA
jgi:hypothetical protein